MMIKNTSNKIAPIYTFDELTREAQYKAIANLTGMGKEYFEGRKAEEMREYISCENGMEGWSVLSTLYYKFITAGMPFVGVSGDSVNVEENYGNIDVYLKNIYLDNKEGAEFLKYWLDKSGIKIKHGLRSFFLNKVLLEVYIDGRGRLHIRFDCDVTNKWMNYTSLYLEKVSDELKKYITKNFIEVVNDKMNESIRKIQDYQRSESYEAELLGAACAYISDDMQFFKDGTLYK